MFPSRVATSKLGKLRKQSEYVHRKKRPENRLSLFIYHFYSLSCENEIADVNFRVRTKKAKSKKNQLGVIMLNNLVNKEKSSTYGEE